MSLVYAKTIDLSITALDESGSLTLMSSDTERIVLAFMFVHDTWATLVELCVAIYILESSLGLACIGPAVVAFGKHSIVSSVLLVCWSPKSIIVLSHHRNQAMLSLE